eukprot:TRINITY_DN21908_c1_g1_i1.p1 TRINITY_DN21908_c1_g1~~TRINITY_DN21908_c1_g1_i1.p1  ORF type:complete len:484 (+),score=46.16 TRINITY_DN21908_c1_g1_i1:58-1509(+)
MRKNNTQNTMTGGIGWFSSFMLIVNNITGPGLVVMPLVFAQGGWVLAVASLGVCMAVSFGCGLMLLEAVRSVPGNKGFSGAVEIGELIEGGVSRRWAWVLTAILIASFHMNLIASILEASQTLDAMLTQYFPNQSCALEIHPAQRFTCHPTHNSTEAHPTDSPYGDSYVISLGYILIMATTIPLSRWDIDGNIHVQNAAFFLMNVVLMYWCVAGYFEGPGSKDGVPSFGSSTSIIPGTILFNFAFVTTLPSWAAEKHPSVGVKSVLWSAGWFSTVLFAVVGLLPAFYWDFSTGSADLLTVLLNGKTTSGFTKVTAYAFPLITVVTSIPIYSIVIRKNLVSARICSQPAGFFWGAIFPWMVSVPLYAGSMLESIADWSGAFITIPLNFILPAYFFLATIKDTPEEESSDEELIHVEDAETDPDESDCESQSTPAAASVIDWSRFFASRSAARTAIWTFIALCAASNVAAVSVKFVALAEGSREG